MRSQGAVPTSLVGEEATFRGPFSAGHVFQRNRDAVYRRSSCLATERLEIVRTRLGDRAGTAGATLVLDRRLAPEAVDRQLARRAAA
jgi:hypothetical protein